LRAESRRKFLADFAKNFLPFSGEYGFIQPSARRWHKPKTKMKAQQIAKQLEAALGFQVSCEGNQIWPVTGPSYKTRQNQLSKMSAACGLPVSHGLYIVVR
jgi:hypothetical protein